MPERSKYEEQRRKRVPLMVSLAELRKCQGYTVDGLRARLAEDGINVTLAHLGNIERGSRGGRPEVIEGIRHVLGIVSPIFEEDDLRALLADAP